MTDITLEQRARQVIADWHREKGCSQQVIEDCLSGNITIPEFYMELLEAALRLSAGADADAARYRFLRRNWQFDITTDVWMWCDVDGIDDTDKLDATIDERIAAAPRHEPGDASP